VQLQSVAGDVTDRLERKLAHHGAMRNAAALRESLCQPKANGYLKSILFVGENGVPSTLLIKQMSGSELACIGRLVADHDSKICWAHCLKRKDARRERWSMG
jgi:hypothetical protein